MSSFCETFLSWMDSSVLGHMCYSWFQVEYWYHLWLMEVEDVLKYEYNLKSEKLITPKTIYFEVKGKLLHYREPEGKWPQHIPGVESGDQFLLERASRIWRAHSLHYMVVKIVVRGRSRSSKASIRSARHLMDEMGCVEEMWENCWSHRLYQSSFLLMTIKVRRSANMAIWYYPHIQRGSLQYSVTNCWEPVESSLNWTRMLVVFQKSTPSLVNV